MSPDVKVPVEVDGRTLTLTNLGKVLYPDSGFTKAEVLDYYQRVAPALLPHIAGRPLTLKRYPEGVDGEAFFQKHVTAHRPDWIRTATVESDSSRARGTTVTYLVVDDLPALIWAANLAGLELHVPQWRVPHVREPDLLVFDLDPGAPANITDCCRVAESLRPMLEADGLAPLAKTSGGKGLQLYAAVSGITGLTITIPVGQQVRPLPDGDRYLGFIFAEAGTRHEVEQALTAARDQLRVTID